MPNVNAPFGLRVVRRLDGQALGPVSKYAIASALAENIGRGSVVKTTGTGAALTPTIQLAAAGNTVLGVFVGCEYRDTTGAVRFSPNWVSGTVTFNSEPAIAYVIDDPNAVFEVQVATVAVTDIGQAADIVVGAPDANGNATTSMSSTFSANATLQLLGISKNPQRGQNVGAFALVEVRIVEHELSGVAGFVAT